MKGRRAGSTGYVVVLIGAAGLVDEVRLFLSPVIVGGGTRALPDGVRLGLELQEERRFDNGTVYVRYRATNR